MANELDKTIEELEAEVLGELEEANGQDAPMKSAAPADKIDTSKSDYEDTGKAVVDPEQKDSPAKKIAAKAKEVGGDAQQKGEGKPDKMAKIKEDANGDESDEDEAPVEEMPKTKDAMINAMYEKMKGMKAGELKAAYGNIRMGRR